MNKMILEILPNVIFRRIKKIMPSSIRMYFFWSLRHDFYLPPQAFGCNKKNYAKQKKYTFSKSIKFSILVPIYNTPKKFLMEMIGSVLFQTYENWELCLADGSDSEHKYVEQICTEISSKDNRIKYKKLEKNNGISENTNACISMASGDYISLFDHDDLLHPCALFETMRAICEKNADFVYTDELIFRSPKLHNIKSTNFKPDFAPDYFHSTNYLCHFSSFKKSLLNYAGNFDAKTDGSQDFDLFLRLSEHTNKIIHIPKCLYFWRASSSSTANGIQSKTYAINAGKVALENHFKRSHIEAAVTVYNDVLYKIDYSIINNPLVSIILINDKESDLEACISSIKNSTTYGNYELIIINTMDSIPINSYPAKTNKITQITLKEKNNYSEIYNLGYKKSTGEYIVFLKGNIQILSQNWIEEMLMYAQFKDVGAVGSKIYNMDRKLENTGTILGIKHFYGYAHNNLNNYGFRLSTVQNCSAIKADCMMLSREIFSELNLFDTDYHFSMFDIDLCLRLKKQNYRIIWTPHAELLYTNTSNSKINKHDKKVFIKKWKTEIDKPDPFYNQNLTNKMGKFCISGNIFTDAECPVI